MADAWRRSLERLEGELTDVNVPLSAEGVSRSALLEEIHRACRPPVHERYVPTYGALVFDDHLPETLSATNVGPQRATFVDTAPLPAGQARRFADGRGSFVVRDAGGIRGLACFEHSIEYEANLVDLQRNSGAAIVQRTRRDLVKVFTAGTVVTWDRVRWMQKPYADRFRRVVLDLAPGCDRSVLEGLLELCVHWLSPGFHGATFVWSLEERPTDLGGVEWATTLATPRISVARRQHFPALLSVLAQTDGAAVVAADGSLHTLGATLLFSAESRQLVPPVKGTRHTSARRFSFDQPSTVVIVVSDDGPVSIFHAGARIGLVETSAYGDDSVGDRPSQGPLQIRRCDRCQRPIRVELPSGRPRRTALSCPVCGASLGNAPEGSQTTGVDAGAG